MRCPVLACAVVRLVEVARQSLAGNVGDGPR
jgi:hypothetical protein